MAWREDAQLGKAKVQVGLTVGDASQSGEGTEVKRIKLYSQSVTPAEVSAVTAAEQDVTVTGVKAGSKIITNPAATGNATLVGASRTKAANTVAIQYVNPTAGALTPGAGTYQFLEIET